MNRYLDIAIRDFNRVVGIIPAVCVIRESYGYYGWLWQIAQNPKYSVAYRERHYDWIELLTGEGIRENEFYLFLYNHPEIVYGFRYKVENERVVRANPVKPERTIEIFKVNAPAKKYKVGELFRK